jgi:hypothetical protein
MQNKKKLWITCTYPPILRCAQELPPSLRCKEGGLYICVSICFPLLAKHYPLYTFIYSSDKQLCNSMKKPEASKSNIPGYVRGRIGKILCNPGRWLNIVSCQFYSTPPVLSPEHTTLPWMLPWILELDVSDVLHIYIT